MGVGQGAGVDKKGFVSKAARGIGIGLLVAAMAACSSSSKGATQGTTLQQALTDYFNGNITLAKSEFEAVVKNDPNDKYAWYNLGVIAQGANDTAGAATDYLAAIKIDPTFESPNYNLGVLRFQENKISDAITYLTDAVTLNANDANAHWNLGLALTKMGTKADNALATKELNKALVINPKLLDTLGPVQGPGKKAAPSNGGTGPASGGSTATTSKSTNP